MYMAHAIAPQILVSCTSKLPGSVQFLMPNSFWELFPSNSSEVMYGLLEVLGLDGMSFAHVYMSCRLMFLVVSEGTHTYACIILSPVSLHTCFVVGQTKYQATGV